MKFLRIYKTVLLVIIAFSILSGISLSATKKGQISGTITDIDTKEPIVGVTITILNKFGGSITDTNGIFILKNLSLGKYQLRISHIGYEKKELDDVNLSDKNVTLNVELKSKDISIKSITVTPGVYSIIGEETAHKETLSRQVLEQRPQLGEDLFRAVQRLPGVVNSDFSAKFNIRGGEQDEVLITVDGMEIYEPYHLRDVDGGVISIIDISTVEGVSLMTGGYPAIYGDRMSGVFNIRTKVPSVNYNRFSVGISALNMKLTGEGTFAGGKGSWLVSARRGHLDLLLKVLRRKNELRPLYYDFYNKVQYKLNNNNILTSYFLHANDNLKFEGESGGDDNNFGDTLNSSYGNTYFWLRLNSMMSSKLVSSTIAYLGEVNQKREGQLYNTIIFQNEMEGFDNRKFSFYGLKTDWEFELTKDILIRSGFDFKQMSARYDYFGRVFNYRYYDYGSGPVYQLDRIDSKEANINPKGNKISSYITNRFRIFNPLTIELGVRNEYSSYSNDNIYSPRINLAFDINDETSFRFGWGHFYQIERLDEISVQDGETEFYEAQKAEHFTLGLEHNLKTGENYRVQVFYKKYEGLRPGFRNTFGELLSFPELEEDRVRINFNGKTSKGIEFYLKKETNKKISWWISYVYSIVEEDIKSIYYFNEALIVNYNKKFPFIYDQMHTLYFDFSYKPDMNWQFNMAIQFHTGWPYTDVDLKIKKVDGRIEKFLQAGEPWAEQYPPFKRIDFRINRKFTTSRGVITAYVEVLNLLANENIRNYEYVMVSNNGVISIDKYGESWFSVMPSVGFTYNFSL